MIRGLSFRRLALAIACAWTVESVAADSFQGKVIAVHDGDTLTVLKDDHSSVKIRLAEIDAPECGQPWSRNAKQALSALTFGQRVTVIPNGTSYDRTIAWVTVGTPAVDVSASLVQGGQAWVYTQYLKRPELLQIEARNKAAHIGLWSLPASEISPPWEWRHSGHPMLRTCDNK